MAKTQAPREVSIPRIGRFVADAVPDPFDERDLEYRARLDPLPPGLDQRVGPSERYVMKQEGNSCTGHALAAVINCVLAQPSATSNSSGPNGAFPHASPYMLYWLARRYDEFGGEADFGSSLRGALKGWFNHGVVLEDDWPGLESAHSEHLDDEEVIEKAGERPLGAFYRVNPYRLDDMQSAISELNAIAASAQVHEGWIEPIQLGRNGQALRVIARPTSPSPLGGHAFAIVGYNEVGFLVHNSWGQEWGAGGFATLPYEDWLDSAYDAWVARPGVPKTPFATGRTRTATATDGNIASAPGPDLRRLAAHVVNLGNDGRLSTLGRFASSASQIDRIFSHMDRWHETWLEQDPSARRHVVLYAHGGLVNESGGLETAQKHLNWWLNNRIYPIYFAWQSGPEETLINRLVDAMRSRLPFGGVGFDLVEQFDALVEKSARATFRWMWAEMKQNARAASDKIKDASAFEWPPRSPEALSKMRESPGGSLTVHRLAEYVRVHGRDNVSVHLVGHSAGSIFLAPFLQRLLESGIAVDSMALLAAAIRRDEFERDVLPHVGTSDGVRRFATFALSDDRELDDVCGYKGVNVYHKSLLYLVSRALEHSDRGTAEVPLAGMKTFLERSSNGAGPLGEEIAARGGQCIYAPSRESVNARSDSMSHGGFDDDSLTMTSVVMRVRELSQLTPESTYEAHTPLRESATAPGEQDDLISISNEKATDAAGPAVRPVGVGEPGEVPVVDTAGAQKETVSPPRQPGLMPLEVSAAPRSGSPVIDALIASGWEVAEE